MFFFRNFSFNVKSEKKEGKEKSKIEFGMRVEFQFFSLFTIVELEPFDMSCWGCVNCNNVSSECDLQTRKNSPRNEISEKRKVSEKIKLKIIKFQCFPALARGNIVDTANFSNFRLKLTFKKRKI